MNKLNNGSMRTYLAFLLMLWAGIFVQNATAQNYVINPATDGGFADDTYWSSSEGDTNNAWYNFFPSDYQVSNIKSTTHNVRAVRAF